MSLPKQPQHNHWQLVAGVLFAVFLWGGNNAAIRYLVQSWPPISVGCTRFICAGLVMLALLRWTNWLGKPGVLSLELKRKLWWQGGLSLAAFVAIFNYAVHFTSASHVALYLAVSPVWALLWEGRAGASRGKYIKAFLAALLAVAGVAILFLPALKSATGTLPGELLGILASVFWTNYGRQCRLLGATLSGAEVSAHTMWRGGVLMVPLSVLENFQHPMHWEGKLVMVQCYCIFAGGITAFALWNHGLRHLKTSEVYLFNNLIPVTTMICSHFTLGEPISHTFWLAMVLIVSGVLIGQADWQKFLGNRWIPAE